MKEAKKNELNTTSKTCITVPVYSDKNYRDFIVKPKLFGKRIDPTKKETD